MKAKVKCILLSALVVISLVLCTTSSTHAQENAIFSVSPGSFTVTDVPPLGTPYTIPQTLVVYNGDTNARTVTLTSEKPAENEITPGYQPIPNENWVTPSPASISISANSYATIQLIFNIPRAESLTGQKWEVWIPVLREPLAGEIGVLRPTVRVKIETTATLPPGSGQGVQVSVSPASKSGAKGATITYSVTVTNTGASSDTFNLQASDTMGWGPTLTITSTTLAENASRTGINLSITIPSTASVGDVSTITVTATGTGYDNTATCTATAITTMSSTAMIISEENFTLQAGKSKYLTATLTSEGNPVEGENITWSATVGTVTLSSGKTDTTGKVSVVYTAPNYDTLIIVSASYAGSEQYTSSSVRSYGTITKLSSGVSTGVFIGIAIVLGCVIIGAAIMFVRRH